MTDQGGYIENNTLLFATKSHRQIWHGCGQLNPRIPQLDQVQVTPIKNRQNMKETEITSDFLALEFLVF